MIHKTLYSIDSNNNIRVWYMEQDGGKYRTISGIKDGSMVTSEWTEAIGKNIGKSNQTTPEMQATKEILSKYKKQLKTGYGESETNTGTVYVEPMLAKKYADYVGKIKCFSQESWGMQCKFNGVRCITTKDGLFSRKGEQYLTCNHILDSLSAFFDKYPHGVLDGELFNNDYRQELNKINSLCRKTKHISDKDIANSKALIKYYIYDGYNDNGLTKEEKYSVRKNWIDTELRDCEFIELVETKIVKCAADIDDYYSSLVNNGHEGIMLRNLNGCYENKRSNNLLKMKPEDDAEFVLLDVEEGSGNWSGKAKRLTLVDGKGSIFGATFKGNMEQAAHFLVHKNEWIGTVVTIKFNGFTGLGIPNFAQFDINNQH